MQQEALNSKPNASVRKWRSSIRPQVNNLYHGATLLGVATCATNREEGLREGKSR
jgi:hypothetical protein